MNKIIQLGTGCALAVGLAACGGSGSSSSAGGKVPSMVHGHLTLRTGFTLGHIGGLVTTGVKPLRDAQNGDDCHGTDGADTAFFGGKIQVADQAGAVAGQGEVSDGKITTSPLTSCVFSFTLTDLQPATFYTIGIGSRQITLAAKDLAARADDLRIREDTNDARYWDLDNVNP